MRWVKLTCLYLWGGIQRTSPGRPDTATVGGGGRAGGVWAACWGWSARVYRWPTFTCVHDCTRVHLISIPLICTTKLTLFFEVAWYGKLKWIWKFSRRKIVSFNWNTHEFNVLLHQAKRCFWKNYSFRTISRAPFWLYIDTQGIFDLYRVVKFSSGIIALRRSPIFSIKFRSLVVRTKPWGGGGI